MKITIPGKPIAKKRPRFARRGKFVTTYSDQETEEGKFIIQVLNQLPDGYQPIKRPDSIILHCVFHMPIPKATSKKKADQMLNNEIKHTKKPDLDNLIKFVKDCCNEIIWEDDSQIWKVRAHKRYSDTPRTEFWVK